MRIMGDKMAGHRQLAQHTTFKVILDGVSLGFSKVSNLSASMEFETVAEGGLNDRVHYLPKPRQTMDKLTLEYGVARGDGKRTALAVGSELKQGIVIMVMPVSGSSPIATYQADWGIVTKWEIDALDAGSSGLLIKKVEISHTGLRETVSQSGT